MVLSSSFVHKYVLYLGLLPKPRFEIVVNSFGLSNLIDVNLNPKFKINHSEKNLDFHTEKSSNYIVIQLN